MIESEKNDSNEMDEICVLFEPENFDILNGLNIVINFGTDHPAFTDIEKVCRELGLRIYQINATTDFIMINYFLLVLDPKLITMKLIDYISQMYNVYDDKEVSILFTEINNIKIPDLKRRFIIKQPSVFNYENLKLIFLNKRFSHSRHYKLKNKIDKQLFRLTYILLNLQNSKKQISTNELCNEFNCSSKTIHRDIQLLNSLGNEIVYDKKANVWNLLFNYYKFEIEYDINKNIRDEIELVEN